MRLYRYTVRTQTHSTSFKCIGLRLGVDHCILVFFKTKGISIKLLSSISIKQFLAVVVENCITLYIILMT